MKASAINYDHPVIQVDDLHKSFNTLQVLKGISTTIYESSTREMAFSKRFTKPFSTSNANSL